MFTINRHIKFSEQLLSVMEPNEVKVSKDVKKAWSVSSGDRDKAPFSPVLSYLSVERAAGQYHL